MPNSSGGADILLGDGTGRFTPGARSPITGGSLTLTAGDFNNDGHLDVLVENRMFLGTGTANFGAPIAVVAATPGGLTIMLGNGIGNLVRAKSYTSGFTTFGAGSSFAVFGDFNEDGKIDLAAVQRSGIGILDGDGTGAFNDAVSCQASISTPSDLVAVDFVTTASRTLLLVQLTWDLVDLLQV